MWWTTFKNLESAVKWLFFLHTSHGFGNKGFFWPFLYIFLLVTPNLLIKNVYGDLYPFTEVEWSSTWLTSETLLLTWVTIDLGTNACAVATSLFDQTLFETADFFGTSPV